jgi:ATPase subunit of ABC transporter with duplicated ATPase domains
MLKVDDISYAIAGNPLFEGASATIPAGHKVGMVGRNGAGKTTLFRLIRGELTLDGGAISLPQRARIGGVAQEAPGTEVSLIDTVLAADEERAALLSDTSDDPHRIAEVQTRLADIDAWSGEARASAILKGLGFTAEEQRMPCSAFSGGWRMRVALAGVLFAQPDLLLLDEPTNYLDLEGALWLESYLARYPHTVLIISHDRGLLNRAVGSHPASRGAQADALFRGLRRLRPRPRRDARRAGGGGQEAGGGARASAGLRRPVQGQGDQGQTGAVPRQDAGADDADPHAGGRGADGVFLPRARRPFAAHR